MKLYTEEQIKEILEELQKAFLPKNIECDGAHCIGCWKDVVRTTMQMANSFTPIELPSDEDIYKEAKNNENKFRGCGEYETSAFIIGAKWMRDKIQVGEK